MTLKHKPSSDFLYQFDNRRWQTDIEHHERYTNVIKTISSAAVREHYQRWINEIESRYPQHFKKVK